MAEKLPEFVIYTLSRFVATLPHPARPSRHQPGPHLAPSGLNAASNLGASTSQSPALPPPQPTPAPATKKKTQPKRASAAKRKKAKRGSDEEEDSDIPSEEYSPDEDDDAYEDEDSDSDYGGSSKKRKRGAVRPCTSALLDCPSLMTRTDSRSWSRSLRLQSGVFNL